jgi:hypothetical protein
MCYDSIVSGMIVIVCLGMYVTWSFITSCLTGRLKYARISRRIVGARQTGSFSVDAGCQRSRLLEAGQQAVLQVQVSYQLSYIPGGASGEVDSTTQDFYNEGDLIIGSILHFYGRPFVVCDCDDFTRDYYRDTFGMENFDPVPFDETRPGDREAHEAAQQQLADIAFFARVQDATSASHLIPNIITHNSSKEAAAPKAPKFDFKRMMQFDGVAIRFAAVLDSTRQLDRDRRFIVSLFPSDDTVSVFEPRQRNSGILGYVFISVLTIFCAGASLWTRVGS